MYGAVKKQCLSFDSMKKEICKIADFLLFGVFRRGNKPPVLLGEDKKL